MRREELDGVEHDMDQYAVFEAAQFAAEVDRQMGSEW